jgi:hypothetical protein
MLASNKDLRHTVVYFNQLFMKTIIPKCAALYKALI